MDNEVVLADGVLDRARRDDATISQSFERKGLPVSTRNWSSLWTLLQRPYWTRVWIIHELAVRGILGKSTAK